jgi:hypothetical protein
MSEHKQQPAPHTGVGQQQTHTPPTGSSHDEKLAAGKDPEKPGDKQPDDKKGGKKGPKPEEPERKGPEGGVHTQYGAGGERRVFEGAEAEAARSTVR